MAIEFREFREEDLVKIKEFTEVMPTYFEDWNEFAPILLHDNNCVFYGAFEDDKIIGLGNLKKKTKDVAWIELIRVRPDVQKKGIGTELFRFGDEKAKEMNYKIVAYATEAGNKGSCKIGEKLGFKLLTEMCTFWVKSDEVKGQVIEKPSGPISKDEALEFMKKIPDAPKKYIAIGWEFAPLTKEYFEIQPDMKFYAKNKTILLEYLERSIVTNEIDWVKAIVYGAKEDAPFLISDFANRSKKLGEYMSCITTSRLQPIVEEMGFIASTTDDGRQAKIVLWEKKL